MPSANESIFPSVCRRLVLMTTLALANAALPPTLAQLDNSPSTWQFHHVGGAVLAATLPSHHGGGATPSAWPSAEGTAPSETSAMPQPHFAAREERRRTHVQRPVASFLAPASMGSKEDLAVATRAGRGLVLDARGDLHMAADEWKLLCFRAPRVMWMAVGTSMMIVAILMCWYQRSASAARRGAFGRRREWRGEERSARRYERDWTAPAEQPPQPSFARLPEFHPLALVAGPRPGKHVTHNESSDADVAL